MAKTNRTKIFKKLANLQFAIGLLITIGFLIALGTIIEQDQSLNFYKTNYPESNPLFGLLHSKISFFTFNTTDNTITLGTSFFFFFGGYSATV